MSADFNERDFIEGWSEEFARAIEMFSGNKATVAYAEVSPSPNVGELTEYLWWKQAFEGLGGGFATWIGTPQAAWSMLSASMADDAGGAKQIYLELLGQAEQGAATLLSRQVGKQVRCQTGQIEETCSSTCSKAWEIRVSFSGNELPALIYLIDSSRVGAVTSLALEERPKATEANNGVSEHSYGSRVDQLLDLELPLSVVLGRSVVQLQDVLKLTSGSVVELNSRVSDRVEVIVHGKIVARGEVVSVKGNYGVRITEIISRRDRLDIDGVLNRNIGT